MVQAQAATDRLTPALVGLTAYYAAAGFASLTNVAVAVWVMVLVYCVPIVATGATLALVGTRRATVRRGDVRRPVRV